jgi:isopropylmalate/homocitrate/citramalate synthase
MVTQGVSSTVTIREVLPRDGFQDLSYAVPAAIKIAVIERLWGAGLRWIEVSSLVSPRAVPQFADAEEVVAAVRSLPELKLSVFVPNRRGLERAHALGADEVSLAVAATDTLSQSNFGMSRTEALAELTTITNQALGRGLDVSITIGGALGCPFEGQVATATVVELAQRAAAAGAGAIFVADTIGAGTAEVISATTGAVRDGLDGQPLGIHLHGGDAATAGILQAVQVGATIVDASLTGLGGCPFVPHAPGNVSTEAVVRCLDEQGITHAHDLDELLAAATDVDALLERARLESGVARR